MLTVHDLERQSGLPARHACEVCIVGGGAVGLYLASRLVSRGLRVTLLEAGGPVPASPAALGFESVCRGDQYRATGSGRFLGLGGSTAAWGGVLVPYSEHDARIRADGDGDTWDHIVDVVASHTGTVLRHLGYKGSPDFRAFAHRHVKKVTERVRLCGLDVMADIALPLRRRNLAFLLGRAERAAGKLDVFLHAVAADWELTRTFDGQWHVRRVVARGPGGSELRVDAECFVLAAGTLESTRILLEIDRASSGRLLKARCAVGRGLGDHLSVRIAEVLDPAAARLLVPRFDGPWMRRFRFVESDGGPDVPRGFCHLIFDFQHRPGFKLIKEWVQPTRTSERRLVRPVMLAAGLPELCILASVRYLRRRLHVPRGTRIYLQLDLEQAPCDENRLALTDEMDRYGRPIPSIHWSVSETDLVRLRDAAERFIEKWRAASLPRLAPTPFREPGLKPHDTYHPVGTCRMGRDSDSVVDGHARVRGTENLWLLSTGIFPSAGTANPTFSLLCFAELVLSDLAARRAPRMA